MPNDRGINAGLDKNWVQQGNIVHWTHSWTT